MPLFTVNGLAVTEFVLFLDLALAIGGALFLWLCRQRGFAVGDALDTLLMALPAALIGARLQYVLSHWPEYAPNPVTALNVWEGGLALPGAVTAAALAVGAARRLHSVSPACLFDAAAPALALAQAIGRLGCVSAGCALGQPLEDAALPLAMALPDATGAVARRFPSQYAEAIAELILGIALLAFWRRRPSNGSVGAAYLLGYGSVRLLFEPLRADSTWLGPLPVATWWAMGAALTGAILLLAGRRRSLRASGTDASIGRSVAQ